MKTLGTGWVRGMSWRDIEVSNHKSGRPDILMSGGAKEVADGLGVTQVMVTLSHCRAYATATAIAVQG